MPEYTTVASEETRYGTNDKKFIEISRKKVLNEDGDESEFVNIAKGHYNRAGSKEYDVNLGFPGDSPVKEFIVDTLKKI